MIYYHDNKIGFRKVSREDLDDLLELKSESWNSTHKVSLLGIEDQIRWFESLDRDPHTPNSLFLIAEENKIPIGVFKFNNIDWFSKRADVGWDVFYKFRGIGLGHKLVRGGIGFATKVLQLHRLNAEILENNIASQKCAEGGGFKLEGVKKSEILRNGIYVDNKIYGIILWS